MTSFTIYDRYNHLCPFDKGLVDQGVNLYFSGYIKPIDNEDPSTNDGVLVSKAGPIREWWVYGFDGGATCRLSKLVVEFLLDFGFQSPKFEDLIQHIKSFGEFCEVEELLLREAQFLCNQILSFDEEFPEEEIPMVSYPCIQTLIKLTGITLSKQRKKKTMKVNQ
ncbi:hypothetical protein NQ317_000122 [Molorchus minor]|uniref:RFTS domain-containing protein n=1 Tax=Molorchus minor TaxID=1323400 RepID=A0ABQ9JU50_9CUCU|nr:hypothetical protein NQ317_000122 [Molorchus minor]